MGAMHDYLYDLANWTESSVNLTKPSDEFIVETLVDNLSPFAQITVSGLTIGKTYRFVVEAYATSANSKVNAARVTFVPTLAPVAGVTAEDVWQEISLEFTASSTAQNFNLQAQPVAANCALSDIAKFRNLVLERKIIAPTGPELIANGDFTADTTGWTAFAATLAATNAELNITRTGNWYSAIQQVVMTSGNDYVLALDKTSSNDDDYVVMAPSAVNNTGLVLFGPYNEAHAGLAIGRHAFPFIADANRYLWLGASTPASANGVRKFDNVSLKAATILWEDVDSAAYTLTAESGSFAFSGATASLLKTSKLQASAGSFAYAGHPASLLKSSRLPAEGGAFAFTGHDAQLIYSGAIITRDIWRVNLSMTTSTQKDAHINISMTVNLEL